MTKVYDAFPVKLWKYNFKSLDLLGDVLSDFNSYPENAYSNVGGWQSFKHLHTDSRFLTLVNEIMTLVEEPFRYFSSKSPRIIDMWANVNPTGAFNQLHDHGNSMVLSGVAYLQTNNSNGHLHFMNPNPAAKFSVLDVQNETTGQVFTIPVNTGDLVFFPCWLDHYTSVNATDDTRVSIAFNIGAV
jgi:uncharacterized protein (TIGR02466 family)